MAITKITVENFNDEVLQSTGLTLVDFWAEWCGPCKQLSPELDKLDNENGDLVKVCKANTDETGDIAMNLGIRSIPAMVIFKDGEEVSRIIGYNKKSEILDKLNNL